MSRSLGPTGRLQRIVAAAFTREPERVFALSELVDLVTVGGPKPHDYEYQAIARAAKSVAAKLGWIKRGGRGRGVYFMHPETAARFDAAKLLPIGEAA